MFSYCISIVDYTVCALVNDKYLGQYCIGYSSIFTQKEVYTKYTIHVMSDCTNTGAQKNKPRNITIIEYKSSEIVSERDVVIK